MFFRDAQYNYMISSKTKLLNTRSHLKCQQNVQGFSIIEVLVAALLTLSLTGVAMQTIVAATAVRVRAQESTEATGWMRSDFANIKPLANGENMGYCPTGSTATGCSGISNNYQTSEAKCNASSITSGYANDLKTLLGEETDLDSETTKSNIGRRPYLVRRTTSVKDSAPYATLEITYSVYRGTSATGTPMNTFYAEVIPGVALACR
jgi:type II secretory pathway pseudopilin PulG